ncbi:asparagine synthase (glutamine-hydrolyzing) [candidate division BRC1 bacterium HGW-BRC1-1]|jgi:asparagine synthase (glutamine-hydrolysing)|nr:MAG: asparagine synthase (glutamine-hydrolyzing) [candidate division BRC1 bacterium HGW-BRC1-1]
MCGFTGKLFRDPSRPVDGALIERMKACMAHRGPDENGTHLQGSIGLGFQRLAVIDLESGSQPMQTEDGKIVIVFNGEVYNFPLLRAELKALGHNFRTRSDTETVLYGYRQWGPAVLERLHGMFAFAIFNHTTRTLFMARDRVGKKPLYYAHLDVGTPDEALIFASEMKSLLAEPRLERRLNPMALNHYLTYQYVPHPFSILEGVHKLPPAHYLRWNPGSEPRIERYWHLEYEPKTAISIEDAVERTHELADEAVKMRMVSDVPLGCFLSGGVDSSLVTALMRRHVSGPLRTFSIGFNEAKFNELPYARQVAEKLETTHEEFIVEPNALECLGALAWHYDEPFADSSAIATYYLARMTKQFVTVALCGDGGDESFAGYTRYGGLARMAAYSRLPEGLRRTAAPLLRALERSMPGSPRARQLSFINRASLMEENRLYVENMVIFRDTMKHALLSPAMRAVMDAPGGDSEALTVALMADGTAKALVDRMMYGDISLYLPGALLPKVDRATMAHGLEGRSPLLDQHVMEFAARLPADVKFPNGRHKTVLKKVASRYFSEEFLNRPKMGFGVPVGEWFRGPLAGFTRDFLLGQTASGRGWFDMTEVKRLVEDHTTRRTDHSHRLWTLMMLEAWAQTFLDRSDPTDGPLSF